MTNGKEVVQGLLYSEEHEWVKDNGDGSATCGLTDYAQNNLGDIVYVECSVREGKVQKGDTVVIVESAKAASDVYTPLSGEILEVNSDLESFPEVLNESPYENAWLFKMNVSDKEEFSSLMSADEYKAFIEK